jgi:hypothetical protein
MNTLPPCVNRLKQNKTETKRNEASRSGITKKHQTLHAITHSHTVLTSFPLVLLTRVRARSVEVCEVGKKEIVHTATEITHTSMVAGLVVVDDKNEKQKTQDRRWVCLLLLLLLLLLLWV